MCVMRLVESRAIIYKNQAKRRALLEAYMPNNVLNRLVMVTLLDHYLILIGNGDVV